MTKFKLSPHYAITVAVAIVVGGGAFYGGTLYQKQKDSLVGTSPQNIRQRLQNLGLNTGATSGRGGSGGAFFRSGGAGSGGGGFSGGVSGQVINLGSNSLTIKVANGSTRTVYYSSSTIINKSVKGAASDLSANQAILVAGTPNSDGSLTASSIDIRPSP